MTQKILTLPDMTSNDIKKLVAPKKTPPPGRKLNYVFSHNFRPPLTQKVNTKKNINKYGHKKIPAPLPRGLIKYEAPLTGHKK